MYGNRIINLKKSNGNSCEVRNILYQVDVWANESSNCKIIKLKKTPTGKSR